MRDVVVFTCVLTQVITNNVFTAIIPQRTFQLFVFPAPTANHGESNITISLLLSIFTCYRYHCIIKCRHMSRSLFAMTINHYDLLLTGCSYNPVDEVSERTALCDFVSPIVVKNF